MVNVLSFAANLGKRKKAMFLTVLFFVFGSMFLLAVALTPAPTLAASTSISDEKALDTSWLDPAPAGTSSSMSWLDAILWPLKQVLAAVKILGSYIFDSGIMSWLFGELISLISQLFKYVAEGSATLFRYVLSEIIVDAERIEGGQVERAGNQWAITRGGGNTAVLLIAWNMVKNWANMIIVLLLIASAAMMILRLWADKAKKLLTDVIILALLINFSIVFIGLIIDASNIVTKTLIVGAEQEVLIIKQIDKAWNAVARPLNKPIDFRGVANYLAIAGLLDIMYLIAAFVLLAFSLIVIQRYIVLAILFVLSPLAFAFRIFPHESATGLWNSWWQNFLKYCFMLVPAAFFLRLSSEILVALNWGELRKPENLTVLVFNFIIVMGFLIAGLIITKKSMGPVVGAVMGMATKIATGTVGLAAGAATSLGLKTAKTVGGGLANVSGATRAYNAAKDWTGDKLTAIGEKTRILKQGALANRKMAKADARGMKEYEKTAENMANADPKQYEKVLTTKARTPEAVRLKAAATRHAAKAGKLEKYIKDPKEQAEALKDADKHYGARDKETWDKAKEKDLRLIEHDEEAIKDADGDKEKAIKDHVGKLNGRQIAEMGGESQKIAAKHASPKVLKRALEDTTSDGRKAIIEGLVGVFDDVENIDKNIDKVALIPETDISKAIKSHPRKNAIQQKLKKDSNKIHLQIIEKIRKLREEKKHEEADSLEQFLREL